MKTQELSRRRFLKGLSAAVAAPYVVTSTALGQGDVPPASERVDPVSVIESAVQSDIVSHLSDIAIRTGRKIQWDPGRERIVGDADAARLCSRPMRSPWRL
jgi:hypothetical protein